MEISQLDTEARALGLCLRGALHPTSEDLAPDGIKTLVLLGPDEPRFWPIFQESTELADGRVNPLDRWSKRVIGTLAARWGGTAIFPSDGPPFAPFVRWAERSGQAWRAPVGLLVHEQAGLFISYRGAIGLPLHIALPKPQSSPCPDCAAPCATACPVGALAVGRDYDVPACMAHLRSAQGAECRKGCLVRRACPVAVDFDRVTEQSSFHMSAFLGE